MNLLDYGPGGSHSFVDTKHKKAEKPEFWPDSLSFEKYSYPAVASIKENEDLIESILDFYGYDIETHCHFSKVKEKRQRKQKQTKQVIIEGLKDKSDKEEESQNSDKEQEEQEEEEETTKSKKKEKPKNKRKKVNFLDEEDDESSKKTKPRKNPVSQLEKNPYEKI